MMFSSAWRGAIHFQGWAVSQGGCSKVDALTALLQVSIVCWSRHHRSSAWRSALLEEPGRVSDLVRPKPSESVTVFSFFLSLYPSKGEGCSDTRTGSTGVFLHPMGMNHAGPITVITGQQPAKCATGCWLGVEPGAGTLQII